MQYYYVDVEYVSNARIELTNPFYPYGQCLHIEPVRNNREDQILSLVLVLDYTKRTRILLMDPQTKYHLFPKPVEMQGDEIATKMMMNKYMIRTSLASYLQGDPTYPCTSYTTGSYETCVLEEAVDKIFSLLSCLPPWLENTREVQNMSTTKHSICEGRLNVTESVFKSVGRIFFNIYNNHGAFNCPAPCKIVSYEVRHDYSVGEEVERAENQDNEGKALVLGFEESVLVRSTVLSIGVKTLLTRLGGYIGGGRTLFWLVVALLGLVNTCKNLISTCRP